MRIAIARAKAQFSELLRRVEAGEEIELTRYGQSVARIVAAGPRLMVGALKARAARSGRSAEAEHRRILEEALRFGKAGDFFEAVRARRIKLSAGLPDTTELLRQARNRDGA